MRSVSELLQADSIKPELAGVIQTILEATKRIAQCVRQGALAGMHESTSDKNIHGETQQKMDVFANELLKIALLNSGQVCAIASEEEGSPIAGHASGAYVVAFDPLDGSSNMDVNGPVGTIFTIYPARSDVSFDSERQFRQMGIHQVCAGYVLYGGSTLLVMSVRGATRCFTLDIGSGDFLLTQKELKVPPDTSEFAINLSNRRFWSPKFRHYVDDLLAGDIGPRRKHYNMRWNAAMVGDVHRVLVRGGIFSYPLDNRNPRQPAKLRLLYEANPMAMLIEGAGGKAFAETQRILTLEPDALHQRVSVILGSANEVEACLAYLCQ